MLDSVFAFLQLGDVQLRLGAVQSFEPNLIVVDGGDDGAARHKHTVTLGHSYRTSPSSQATWSVGNLTWTTLV